MKDQHELDAVVKQRLNEIKPVPPRNLQMASRGRAQFLGRAVSAYELPRQKGWILNFRKEQYAMNVLLSILVIAGLLFGGGATVQAAQDDLPNEPLYAVKTWTEDIGLQFQNNPEDKVNRLMELAQVRVQEMVQVSEGGEPIPDQVPLRLEQHIRQAMQICTNMDDDTLNRTLLQLREHLQEQERVMEQLQLRTADPDALQLMTQNRTMLQERLRLVEDGLIDPELFRNQVQNGFQYGQDDELTPPAQDGNGQQNGGQNTDPGGNTNGSNENGSGGNSNDNGSGGGSNDNGSGGDSNDNGSGGGSNDNGFGEGSNDNSSGGDSNDNGSGGDSNDNGSGGGSNDNGSGGGGNKP